MRQLPWLFLLLLIVMVAAILLLRGPDASGPGEPVPDPGLAPIETPAGPREATLEGAPDAAPAPPAAAEPEVAPDISPDGTWEITGRVLDERRRPVAGARIQALGFSEATSGTSNDRGRFRLFAAAPTQGKPAVGVYASHPDGRAAWRHVPTGPYADGHADAGDLILKAAAPLAVAVMTPDGSPAAGARVQLEGVEYMAALPVAEETTNAEGHARFLAVPPGEWRLIATREGLGRGVQLLDLRRERPALARVALTAPVMLEVTVLDKETEAPIENARVLLLEYFLLSGARGVVTPYRPLPAIPPTNAAGRTSIVGLGASDAVQVHAEADGYPQGLPLQTMMYGLQPGQTEQTVLLSRVRTITWPLKDDGSPAPPDGTELELRPNPSAVASRLPSAARMEGGAIVGDAFERYPIHAFAVAPDGRYARLFCLPGSDAGHETAFTEPREIVVIARQPDGTPGTGFFVSARSQGNNVLAPSVPLDQDGKAVLRLLFAYRVDVFLSTSEQSYGGIAIGTLDLSERGGTIETEVPGGRPVVLAVEIDGERRLPASYFLHIGQDRVQGVEEDAERGELRFTAYYRGSDAASRWVHLSGTGYESAKAELPTDEGTEVVHRTVELTPACTLTLRIGLPEGGQASLRLETWHEEKATWVPVYRHYAVRLRAEPGGPRRRRGSRTWGPAATAC